MLGVHRGEDVGERVAPELLGGRFAEARAHLNCVTNETYAELKTRLTRNLNEQEKKGAPTNAPPAAGQK